MKFRTRIWMMPIAAGLIFAIGIGASVYIGTRTAGHIRTVAFVDSPALDQVSAIDRNLDQFQLVTQAVVGERDVERLPEATAFVEGAREAAAKLGTFPGRDEASKELARLFDTYQHLRIEAVKVPIGNSGDPDAVLAAPPALEALENAIKARHEEERAKLAESFGAVTQGVTNNIWAGVITGLAALLALGVVSWRVTSSVWRELGGEPDTLRALARDVADGRLDVRIDVASGDTTSLNAAMAEMVVRLREIVEAIHVATDSIRGASDEIATGNMNLSERTEATASNLQRSSDTMGQLTAAVRQSAEAARDANDLARDASAAAERGGRLVDDVVASMEEISTASSRIHEIIGVIDGIAFQTNILALNAAVEAARAGDQGRGFAVVAGEVRTLAQRSAQAAREIKELIVSSGEKIDGGTQTVGQAGASMSEILEGVKRVRTMLGEITAATAEQSQGIAQVNDAVSNLESATQQNAALVEESAAAAESLREQAGLLAETVSRFRLADAQPAA